MRKLHVFLAAVVVVVIGCNQSFEANQLPNLNQVQPSLGAFYNSDQTRVIEYYHASYNHYFLTADSYEQSLLDSGATVGWQRTGYEFSAYKYPAYGRNGVCRFYGNLKNGGADTHFFSADPAECEKLRSNPAYTPIWIDEGTAFYSELPAGGINCPTGTLTIKRLYNQSMGGAPNHRYLAEIYGNEISSMEAQGWLVEGPVFCSPLPPATSPPPGPGPSPSPTPGPSPSPSPTPTPIPTGGDLCAGFADVQRIGVPLSILRTVMPFYFGNGTVAVAEFQIPAGYSKNAYIDATVAEWQGPPTLRTATISTRPCDFRSEDSTGVNGPLVVTGGLLPQATVDIGAGNPNPRLMPGQTYYFNVINGYASGGQIIPTCQPETNCKASFVIFDRQK